MKTPILYSNNISKNKGIDWKRQKLESNSNQSGEN